ncbi:MAG: DUF998 domain-containing protein [Acidimicrobiales bacterium]
MGDVVVVSGGVALVGVAIAIASLVYLHLAPTGLSPVHNAVSQYGISKYRAGYRAATTSLGIAGAALAFGVANVVRGSKGTTAAVALLVVFAVGRLVISWIPMDEPESPRTSTGQAHGLIAIVTFVSVTAAAFRLGSILRAEGPWHVLAQVSTSFAWAMAACIVAMVLGRASPTLRSWFGAIERGFYGAMIGWVTVFAVACVIRSG